MKTFFRTFLLQGFWNYAQMQNIGALFIMMPGIKQIYKDNEKGFNRALRRNIEAFNSNPVMSVYSIGAMIKQERKIAVTSSSNLEEEEREFRIIRASTANTAASIGDRLFWATLKPLSLALSLIVLFGGEVRILQQDMSPRAILSTALLAVIGSLLVYNIPALTTRYRGLLASYKGNEENFYGLINVNWNKTIYFLKTLGQVLTGFIIFYGLYIMFRAAVIDADSITRIALLTAFVILSLVMKRLQVPAIYLYIAATAVFLVASLLA